MHDRFALSDPKRLDRLFIDAGQSAVAGGNPLISGLARFGLGQAGDLCFCDRDPDPMPHALPAGLVVLTTTDLANRWASEFPEIIWIGLPDPRATFIDLAESLLVNHAVAVTDAIPRPLGIHPSARIGEYTVIDPATRIDAEVTIGHHCVIHRGTWLQAGTVVRDHCTIGCAGINAYRGLDGRRRGFPHLAGVIVGEAVEIGAGTVIPRGILTSTLIGDETVIGNLCNIGHGVVIGNNAWLSVGCLIGGHAIIGDDATLAMGSTVRDNLTIGAGAQIGMGSVVARAVEPGASVFGNPARNLSSAMKAGPER